MVLDETLDLRGLKCPLPALMAKRALAKAAPGTVLMVLADDPLASVDIPHMCHAEGHAVETVASGGTHHIFTLRKGLGRKGMGRQGSGQDPA
jgi:tRNA 2-thiouridine synthesizing protein A